MPLPTNRTATSTIEEHVADHNTLAEQHNELEGHAADTTGVHGIADTAQLALTGHDHDADYEPLGAAAAAAAALVDAAPGTLDTLNELAAALGDDANFASTVTTALAGKAATTHSHAESDVTNLVSDLAGKAATGHTHAGAYVATTLADAKGDLIAATAADTWARLAVGSDGQVLTADSAQTAGVKWATAASAGGVASIFRSGLYTSQLHTSRTTTNLVSLLNYLHFAPIWVAQTVTVDRLGVEVTSAGSAGSVMRVGIYNNNSGVPGTLAVSTSALATTSTGLKEEAVSQQLTPGLWWLATVAQVAGPTVRATATSSVGLPSPSAYVASANVYTTWVQASVTGALPSPAVASTTEATNIVPVIWLRAA